MEMDKMKRPSSLLRRCGWVVLFALSISIASVPVSAEQKDQQTFASPEAAVTAMLNALKGEDNNALGMIFGPGSEDIVSSGDPVADAARRKKFISIYGEKNKLESQGNETMVLRLGNEDWPFPIPIVQKDGRWRFDTDEGREEILARRIGRNELSVIQVCLAFVDAQRDYALKDWDGDGLMVYARKFRSEPGKKDGLYWETKPGEEQSPLGELFAAAQKLGYHLDKADNAPEPYYGYYYRILEAQGLHASGGAYGYLVEGKMVGGFALVAYPAHYGVSGVMTFMVNHDGVVFQKDLGKDTLKIAAEMKLFDPDDTWARVEENTIGEK